MAGSISGIDWVSKLPVSGVYTAIEADNTADKAVINTGMANATGAIVQIVRAGVVVGAADAAQKVVRPQSDRLARQ